MKKFTLLLWSMVVFAGTSYTQNVGINSSGDNPHTSAGLDINFTDKGVLIPRVALSSTILQAPIPGPGLPENSLLVYNTATAGTAPNNVVPGFYYWQTDRWVQLGSQGPVGPQGNPGATGPAGPSGGGGVSHTTTGNNPGVIPNNASFVLIPGRESGSTVRNVTLPALEDGKVIFIRALSSGNLTFTSPVANAAILNNNAAATTTTSITPANTGTIIIAMSTATRWYIRVLI